MTNTAIQRIDPEESLAARVVIHGDLSGLNDAQLEVYYVQLCRSLGLNPSTRPFTLLKLNGKLMLYANKDCSDQLRKRDKVSVRIVSREEVADLLVITAQAQLPDGRVDEAIGALPLGKLQGEARANALMKCETKAKRRATLSICGLGFPDESEIEGMEAAGFSDNGAGGTLSPHDNSPDANPGRVNRESLARAMAIMGECDKAIFDPGCTWETLNHWRSIMGSKGNPSALGKDMSEMYRGDLSENERKALSALWNRVDRKLTALEGKLKPPSVESSFIDEPDGTEALAPGREPGQDDEEDPL